MNPFKAYDIRGVYPSQVHEDLAYDLGRALPLLLKCSTIVIGRDGRTSSDTLFDALLQGLLESGTNVINIGECSTPQFYYSLYSADVDGGVMITASHNPKEYNGFKICSANAIPVFKENGLLTLQALIEHGQFKSGVSKGHYIEKNIQEDYTNFFSALKKKVFSFNILIDCGNGMGTHEVQTLRELYPTCTFDVLYEDVDGTFPHHECNPVIEEYYDVLIEKLNNEKYDFGIAFDGDADRLTFFTKEQGLIPPDLMTGIIGVHVAQEHDKVGYEVRTSQAVKEVLESKKIVPCLYPSGHAYIKLHMMQDGAVFAGEKSGHYFYQRLHNTDSSLFTLMNIFTILSKEGKRLHELVAPLIEKYANSGELNYTIDDKDTALKKIEEEFSENDIKHIDGVSIYGEGFFFNIRKSNTENLIRVNIESTNKKKVRELQERIEQTIARS